MAETTIITESDPSFRGGHYDVVNAIVVARAAYSRLGDFLADDLLKDSVAASRQRWLRLIEELRRGEVVGPHGSGRRFGPQTRFFVRDPSNRELSREEWLERAIAVVQARSSERRRVAGTRLGERFSFEAFQTSPDPHALAAELTRVLNERVPADGAERVIDAMIDDLETLGHPLCEWDDNSSGDRRDYVWETWLGYETPEPGEASPAVALQINTLVEVEAGETVNARIEVSISKVGSRPGFPAG